MSAGKTGIYYIYLIGHNRLNTHRTFKNKKFSSTSLSDILHWHFIWHLGLQPKLKFRQTKPSGKLNMWVEKQSRGLFRCMLSNAFAACLRTHPYMLISLEVLWTRDNHLLCSLFYVDLTVTTLNFNWRIRCGCKWNPSNTIS
jgi:hypothetical protein